MAQCFQRGPRKRWRRSSFWKTNLINKRWKCGSGASCDGERPPIEEFVPPGLTVNHAFYKDVLEWLWKQVQRVRPDIADDWVLHHDNAPAHTALSIPEFLAKKNIPLLPHPPYNPELALCDFYLFPKLKSKLKGHHFRMMENIQKIVTSELHTRTENDFCYCYDQWKKTLEPLCNFPRVILWWR